MQSSSDKRTGSNAPVDRAIDRWKDPARIVYLLTAPFGLKSTLGGQLTYLRRNGFEPIVASSPEEQLRTFATREGVRWESVEIEREISLLMDLRALWTTWRLLRRLRPAMTHVSAPKAGLVGGLAAWAARVPCRVYLLRGLRLETASGWRYGMLYLAERLAARAAHKVVCVSPSVAKRAHELRLARPGQLCVMGFGSSNGVAWRRFMPNRKRRHRACLLRSRLGLGSVGPVIGYVGRLTRDKGIADLVDACKLLRHHRSGLRLLLVGDHENGDPVPLAAREAIETEPWIVCTGFVADSAPYYPLMDVIALPSYREGYPTVALEAAAARRPFVTTRATGCADSVADGETGLLVEPGDTRALAAALAALLGDPIRAQRLSRRAYGQVKRRFAQRRVWRDLEALYRSMLDEASAVRGRSGRDFPQDRRYTPNTSNFKVSGWAQSRGKRALDLTAAVTGLLVSGPLLLLLSLAIGIVMGPPVLFRQQRLGRNGRPFSILKLRTMNSPGDPPREGQTSVDLPTPLGGFLRRWSLDELPQLWNVLRGEMSLVGPRPLPVRYEARYTSRQRLRQLLRPGLTGWAQVQGRNGQSWTERFEHDLWYAAHATWGLDRRILCRTAVVVASGSGLRAAGQLLMPEFLGDHDAG